MSLDMGGSDYYCTKCGKDVAADAQVCPSCGDDFTKPPPPATASDPYKISLGRAIAGLVLNIVVWPGLGSLVGGKARGLIQGSLV